MRTVKIIIAAVAVLIALAVGGNFGSTSRQSSRRTRGSCRFPGITDGAVVIRDIYGVPHIYADTTHDLYFALGYCQAQDRLFQMDFYRRAARGRLSEVFGKDLLDADRYLVTMGFARTAGKAA